MDFSERYRIVASRDRRFDGQFVLAVRTTGIYCRPSCPARTPKPGNVEFFTTSAAAHLAGYRACKRCLPEATPGSPQWNLGEGVAARAMRLIGDGVVEREGVTGLARRVGYSPRQLNRLLVQELGAGPLALARATRAHNARQLIVHTAMRFSDVAFAAGFTSIRQFNDTIMEVFGLSPTLLRERASNLRVDAAQAGLVRVALPVREPFDAEGLFSWFAQRALAGVEAGTTTAGTVGRGTVAAKATETATKAEPVSRYARAMRLARGHAVVVVEHTNGRMGALVHTQYLADLPAAFARLRRLFDLDADPVAVDAALGADPRLQEAVTSRPGIRIPGIADSHEAVVRAVIGQQVSEASARTTVQRLVDALGEPLESPHPTGEDGAAITRLFPTAEAIALHARELVRGPSARTATLVRACEALADGSLTVDIGRGHGALVADLRAIRGIGPWTADYTALRALQSPDILMHHDLAARVGARSLGLPDMARELIAQTRHLAPWRSYLSMHLYAAYTSAKQPGGRRSQSATPTPATHGGIP